MNPARPASGRISFAAALVLLGAGGLLAALALTLEKFALLADPDAPLACDFSVLFGCSTNLNSAQGAVFGVPNPLVGLVFFAGVVTVGFVVLAKAELAKWFWIAFNLAVAGSLALVIWFVVQSVYVLGVLCPWCMLTWAVTIPLFWLVTLHNLRTTGPSSALGRAARAAYGWIPLITLVSYLVVAVLIESRLDVLGDLLG